MKRPVFFLVFAVLGTFSLWAQERGTFRVGLNLASLPYLVAEPVVEYTLVRGLSVEASGGYCFNRRSHTMQTVTERVKGGFATLGLRFYTRLDENIFLEWSLAGYYGNFVRAARAEIDHYYGTYTETRTTVQEKGGWQASLGPQFRLDRWVLHPALRFSMISSRGGAYAHDYWTPGIGRTGLSANAATKRFNWGLLPVLQVKFSI